MIRDGRIWKVKLLTKRQLAALDKRIGANADRLIAQTRRTLIPERKVKAKGRPPASFPNCVQPEMLDVMYAGEDYWPLWVDDVVAGIARLDWHGPNEASTPLSMVKVVKCFAMLEVIDTYQISHLLYVGERQAQKYYKACELAHGWLIKGFCEDHIKYPEVFVYPKELLPQTDLKEI
jgi:hypothetical protein